MNVLILFVRYPEAGKVKTRLARSLGFEKAAQIYRNLVEENLQILNPLFEEEIQIRVAYDPPEREAEMRTWLGSPYVYLSQGEGDLGRKLDRIFRTVFLEDATKVLILGSDTLGLRPAVIRDGFRALEEGDLVLGPARDGGYYLIGLKEVRSALFRDIPWSTERVFHETFERAKSQGLRTVLLPELEDLDEIRIDQKEVRVS